MKYKFEFIHMATIALLFFIAGIYYTLKGYYFLLFVPPFLLAWFMLIKLKYKSK